MRAKFEIICVLMVSSVIVKAIPKFGERIVKDASNSSLIDKVFRPTQTTITNVAKDKSFGSNNIQSKLNQTNNENRKLGENHYKPSLEKDSTIFEVEARNLLEELRSSFRPNISQDTNQLDLTFDEIPEFASSDHIHGPPIPPPAPQAPRHPVSEFYGYYPKQNQFVNNYEPIKDEKVVYESAPKPQLDKDLSAVNIPLEFPNLKNDKRADVKKEVMGTENKQGRPWGTKTSYTYKDPKNPHNFMEMSEVVLSVNREMDPQEAQSQIQKFLAVAQSEQYGPMIPIRDNENFDHGHHDHDAEASFVPPIEPIEPNEPKFMNF